MKDENRMCRLKVSLAILRMNVQIVSNSSLGPMADGFIVEMVVGLWLMCQRREQRSMGLCELGILGITIPATLQ